MQMRLASYIYIDRVTNPLLSRTRVLRIVNSHHRASHDIWTPLGETGQPHPRNHKWNLGPKWNVKGRGFISFFILDDWSSDKGSDLNEWLFLMVGVARSRLRERREVT